MGRRKGGNNSGSSSVNKESTKPLVEIPEDEQWRLIRDSNILKSLDNQDGSNVGHSVHDVDEHLPLGEEIFNALLLIIPFSFFLLMMEILIHRQYGQRISYKELTDKMLSGVPILSLFVFYTTRYKNYRKMQFFLFIISILVGSRMIYLINRGSWLVNMRQCPPLATIWVLTIVQLDLGPAVLSLITTGSFVWWKGLKIKL